MKNTGWLIGAILFAICTIFQIFAAIRYYGRFPEDMFGIGIFTLVPILSAIVTIGFFINWRKD